MKPDPAPLWPCATCGTLRPASQMGRYDETDRVFCLRRDGVGGICYRERTILRPTTSIEAIVMAARTRSHACT